MSKSLICALLLSHCFFLGASSNLNTESTYSKPSQDSALVNEINHYLNEISRTVREGDFEGYAALYHEDAVVVFGAGSNKSSVSISKALDGWKKGFADTKAGKVNSNVNFRLSQRINDAETAHETGIFHYTSKDKSGDSAISQYVNYQMLLVKKDGKWLCIMEYQQDAASKEEWDALAEI